MLLAALGVSALAVAACNKQEAPAQPQQAERSEQKADQQTEQKAEEQQADQQAAPQEQAPATQEQVVPKSDNPYTVSHEAVKAQYRLDPQALVKAKEAWNKAQAALKDGKLANAYDPSVAAQVIAQYKADGASLNCDESVYALLDKAVANKEDLAKFSSALFLALPQLEAQACEPETAKALAVDAPEFAELLKSLENTTDVGFAGPGSLYVAFASLPEVQAAANDDNVSVEDFAALLANGYAEFSKAEAAYYKSLEASNPDSKNDLESLATNLENQVVNTDWNYVLVEAQNTPKAKKEALLKSKLAPFYANHAVTAVSLLTSGSDKSVEDFAKEHGLTKEEVATLRDYALSQLTDYANTVLANSGFAFYKK